MNIPSQAPLVFEQIDLICIKTSMLYLFFNPAYQLQMSRNEQVHHGGTNTMPYSYRGRP
jgi:hypothetical protein